MPKQGMKIKGSVKGFIDDLHEFADFDRLARRLDNALDVTGEAVRDTMPVRTGALKASGVFYSGYDATGWEGVIEFGEGLDYSVYVLNKNAPNAWDLAVVAHEPLFEEALRFDGDDL